MAKGLFSWLGFGRKKEEAEAVPSQAPDATPAVVESQAAAAGKQIEAAGTADMECQPVEDGLLDAIRGGSESVHIPDRQFTALPLAADDSYHARSPLGGWALARAVTAGFYSGHRVSSSENKVVV